MKDLIIIYGGGNKIIHLIDVARIKKPNWKIVVVSSSRLIDIFINNNYTFRRGLEERGVDYYVVNDLKNQSIKNLAANSKMSFCIGGPWIFDKEDISRHKVLYNLHTTRLPAYRGGASYSWQILSGDSRGGVTLHNLDYKIDGGDILLQETFEVPIEKSLNDIEHHCAIKTYDFIDKLLDFDDLEIINLKPVKRLSSSIYMPRMKREINSWIDWSWSAGDVEKFIRAFAFNGNGAMTRVTGKENILQILDAELMASDIDFHPFQSGIIFEIKYDILYVSCIKGILKIKNIVDQDGFRIKDVVLGDRFFNNINDLDFSKSSRVIILPDGKCKMK